VLRDDVETKAWGDAGEHDPSPDAGIDLNEEAASDSCMRVSCKTEGPNYVLLLSSSFKKTRPTAHHPSTTRQSNKPLS
jgi:hypothetical protein